MSDNTKVDWTQPIEALYEGRWVPAIVAERDADPETKYPYRVAFGPFTDQWYTEEGVHCIGTEALRNIPQSRQRTTDEQLTHYAERRKALVKRIASDDRAAFVAEYKTEARAIVASMAEVDGDLVEARKIAGDALAGYTSGHQSVPIDVINAVRTGNDDKHPTVVAALAAIRRGRALERGE